MKRLSEAWLRLRGYEGQVTIRRRIGGGVEAASIGCAGEAKVRLLRDAIHADDKARRRCASIVNVNVAPEVMGRAYVILPKEVVSAQVN